MFLLSTLTVDIAGKDGIVLVGEAAHAFPPIGAQGLNLGLRDVADLSASLAAVGLCASRASPQRLSDDYARGAPATWLAPARWSTTCSARCWPSCCRPRRYARAGFGR